VTVIPSSPSNYKNKLFLALAEGANISAQQLDKAFEGRLAYGAQDMVLIAHWLLHEQSQCANDFWWNEREKAQILYAMHLSSFHQNAGWGGRSDYPLTLWVHEQLQSQWPAIYTKTLDEMVLPLLGAEDEPLLGHRPFSAQSLTETAHKEARLRALSIVAAQMPGNLHDKGEHYPLVKLLGQEMYEQVRRKRHNPLNALDFYALASTWPYWASSKTPPMQALVQAKLRRANPYRAHCNNIECGQRYVVANETSINTFDIQLCEHGGGVIKQESFDTSDERFQQAISWSDSLQEHCRQHNSELAERYFVQMMFQLQPFEESLKISGRPSAADFAFSKASKASPSLDAASAVALIRARTSGSAPLQS
jgi:hypothetical protein